MDSYVYLSFVCFLSCLYSHFPITFPPLFLFSSPHFLSSTCHFPSHLFDFSSSIFQLFSLFTAIWPPPGSSFFSLTCPFLLSSSLLWPLDINSLPLVSAFPTLVFWDSVDKCSTDKVIHSTLGTLRSFSTPLPLSSVLLFLFYHMLSSHLITTPYIFLHILSIHCYISFFPLDHFISFLTFISCLFCQFPPLCHSPIKFSRPVHLMMEGQIWQGRQLWLCGFVLREKLLVLDEVTQIECHKWIPGRQRRKDKREWEWVNPIDDLIILDR